MVLALRWRPRGRDRIRLSGYQRYCQWSPITGWSQWSGDRWLWSAWSWPCLKRYFSPFCDQQSAFDLGHHRACPFAASNQNHAFGSSRSLDEASKPIQQPSCLSWKSNFISQCNQGINTPFHDYSKTSNNSIPNYFTACITNSITVFENHRESLIQHCERSELCLHFEWTKVH